MVDLEAALLPNKEGGYQKRKTWRPHIGRVVIRCQSIGNQRACFLGSWCERITDCTPVRAQNAAVTSLPNWMEKPPRDFEATMPSPSCGSDLRTIGQGTRNISTGGAPPWRPRGGAMQGWGTSRTRSSQRVSRRPSSPARREAGGGS